MKAEVSKVQKAEMACHSDETREKASEQPSSTSHTDIRSATDGSVPKSKSRGRNGHKLGAKKWVHVTNVPVSLKTQRGWARTLSHSLAQA